jgi:hypothetical protein
MAVTDVQSVERAPHTARKMAEAARGLLGSLNAKQLGTLHRAFGDERFIWDWLPGEPRPRVGVRLLHMNDDQQAWVMALIDAALDSRAARQVNETRQLERILRQFEKMSEEVIFVVRDPEQFWVAVFGEPGGKEPWGWGITGHHISIHFTVVDGDLVGPWPLFIGAEPSTVKFTVEHAPPVGFRNLAEEEDMARALLASFSAEQKACAVLQREIPWDLLTHSAGHNTRLPDRTLLPTGLPYSEMTGEQRQQLVALIRHYATRPSAEVAEIVWRKIERAGFDEISFAWIGTEERGKGHYYNIVAPTFMIEYDNVQHDANHLHTLWRDFTNDFGQDVLAQHYADHHPG